MHAFVAISLIVLVVLGLRPTALAQTKPADDLTIAVSSFSTETLDPVLGGHLVKFYLSLIYDYLVGATPDGQLSTASGVSDRWDVSADHRQWTFHLRPGVKFHNGDECTSEDVKFSIERAIGKRSTTGFADLGREMIQSIQTPARDRLVILTREPTLVLPSYLSRALSTEGMILSKKYVEAKGDDGFAAHPVGSGPYRVVEQMIGSHLKLEAAGPHWRVGRPRYKTITFRLVSEESTRIALLRRGEADIIEIDRERVKEVQQAGFPVHLQRNSAILHMWWVQPWDSTPIKDPRVREALNLAIDREELASSVFAGLAEPAAIPIGIAGALADVKFGSTARFAYPFDRPRAKKLLVEAGYPNGFPYEIFSYQVPGLPEGRTLAEAVAGYWQQIGVQPKLITVDYAAFRKKWLDRTVPGAVGYYPFTNRDWSGTYATFRKFAYSSERITTIKDPVIDGMLREVGTQTDRDKVNRLMRDIFVRLRGEHLGIPVVYLHTPYASTKKIARWNPGALMNDLNFEELVTSK